jgi:hypothetical protein
MIADDIGMHITVGATCNAIHHSSDNLLLYASLAMNHFSTYFMFTLALFGDKQANCLLNDFEQTKVKMVYGS